MGAIPSCSCVRSCARKEAPPPPPPSERKSLVIIGGSFGGLLTLKELKKNGGTKFLDITVIDMQVKCALPNETKRNETKRSAATIELER